MRQLSLGTTTPEYTLESVLCDKRSHHNEKPAYLKKKSAHSNREPRVPQ